MRHARQVIGLRRAAGAAAVALASVLALPARGGLIMAASALLFPAARQAAGQSTQPPARRGEAFYTSLSRPWTSASVSEIWRVDPYSGTHSLVTSGGLLGSVGEASIMELAMDHAGDVLAATSDGRIVRVDPASGHQSLVPTDVLPGLRDVATGRGGAIFATARAGLYRVDPLTGSQTLLHPSSSLKALTTDEWGRALAIRGDDHILRIDPDTGDAETLFNDPRNEWPYLYDIEVSGADGRIWVAGGDFVGRLDEADGLDNMRPFGHSRDRSDLVSHPRGILDVYRGRMFLPGVGTVDTPYAFGFITSQIVIAIPEPTFPAALGLAALWLLGRRNTRS